MNQAATVVLVNQALRLLGDAAIASFDEGTDLAETCATLADDTLRGLLAAYPWRFTLAKQRLARLAEAPANEWAHQHMLPPDMLALRQLVADAGAHAPPLRRYELFGNRVLSDAPDLWADYQRETEPETWPPAFRLLARYALAADLAVPVANSGSLAGVWTQRAFGTPGEAGHGGQMRLARNLDAQQQPPQAIEDFPLIAARFGG